MVNIFQFGKRRLPPPLTPSRLPSSASVPHFWGVVLHLGRTHELAFGSTIMMIKMLTAVHSFRGMCRAWVRRCLNQNSVEFSLRTLAQDVAQIEDMYDDFALLRDGRA